MRKALASMLVLAGAFTGMVSIGQAADAAPSPFRVAVGGFSSPSGGGYWVVFSDGDVRARGSVLFAGETRPLALNAPIIGGAPTATGKGYWLDASDGGIFSYGDARFYGSMGAKRLNKPVFSMAATKSGKGYWLVARDGGMFSFGDARFYGSTGNLRLNQPIAAMTTSATGKGYRLIARDGGIFSFGDAPFLGSLPGIGVNVNDVVGAAPTPTNKGYWVARRNGAIYTFGDARYLGRATTTTCDPVVAIFSNPKTQGYRMVTASGSTQAFGAAPGGSGTTGWPKPCPVTPTVAPPVVPPPVVQPPPVTNCTPGYTPCLAPASDYDCLGGSGNGPRYTGLVRVDGPDIYDLDRDGDGWGCE